MEGEGQGKLEWDGEDGGHTLVVVDHIAQVVASSVVGFAHAHRVVREIDIAVVAEDWKWLALVQGPRAANHGVMEILGGALTFRHLECRYWYPGPSDEDSGKDTNPFSR